MNSDKQTQTDFSQSISSQSTCIGTQTDPDTVALRTMNNGTKLSPEDLQNIRNDVESGVPYRTIQKKYNIGGTKVCNLK